MAFGLMGVKLFGYATGEKTHWFSSRIFAAAWLPALAFVGAGCLAFIKETENSLEGPMIGICAVTVVILVIASIRAIRLSSGC
jgi:hypothetical protein